MSSWTCWKREMRDRSSAESMVAITDVDNGLILPVQLQQQSLRGLVARGGFERVENGLARVILPSSGLQGTGQLVIRAGRIHRLHRRDGLPFPHRADIVPCFEQQG